MLLEVLLPLIALSLLFYLFHRLPSLPKLRSKVLPSHRLTQPLQASDGSGWNLEFGRFSVSVWTAAANHIPAWIVTRRGQKGQAALKQFYDIGAVCGTAGAAVGVLGTLWAVAAVWKEVWREVSAHAEEKGATEAAHLVKRAMEGAGAGTAAVAAAAQTSSSGGGLQPIIPGITVPLAHLPTLVLALVLNQLLHELGHAVAAALDEVQMTRLTFSLHAIVPSATVTFPSSVDVLPARSKIRLATSGPLHNLVIYLSLWLLASSGVGRLFWRNRSDRGVIVQSVNPMSPLFNHLSPGDLITHVDDVFLGEGGDAWASYLSGSEIGDEGMGWCVDRAVYNAMSAPPCSPESGTVKFEPVEDRENASPRCVATHPILHIPASPCPCPSNRWICVHPSHTEEIVRIRLAGEKRRDQGSDGAVVLFSGDRKEILDGVVVGVMGARFMGGLVRWSTMFLQYMSTIALSLFLINLLPLPHADGSSLLRYLLHLYSRRGGAAPPSSPPTGTRPLQATLNNAPSKSAPSINLSRQYELNSDDEDEYGEEGGRRGESGGASGGGSSGKKEDAWKRRVRRAVEGTMVGCVAAWLAGWAVLALLRSS